MLSDGAEVAFARAGAGEWDIEIAGGASPRIVQPKPAQIEVFRTDADIRQPAAGYTTVQKSDSGIDARAEIACGAGVSGPMTASGRVAV